MISRPLIFTAAVPIPALELSISSVSVPPVGLVDIVVDRNSETSRSYVALLNTIKKSPA